MYFKKTLVAAALMTVLSNNLLSAQTPDPTRLNENTLWSLRRVTEVKTSSDGKTVIYQVRTPDIANNRMDGELFTMPAAGGTSVRLLDKTVRGFSFKFRPDGKKIGFLAPSKNDNIRLYEMNPDGTEIKEVSNNVGDDLDGFLYAPDMKRICYFKQVQIDKTVQDLYPELTKVKAKIIDGLNYRHWDAWEDGAYSHVFIAPYDAANSFANTLENGIDIMKGEAYDCPNPPDGGEEELAWHPSGNYLVYSCKKERGTAYATSTNTDLYCYDVENKTTKNLTTTNKGYDNAPQFSADGKYLAWLRMERAGYESDKNRVVCAPFNGSGNLNPKEVTAKIDLTAASFTWIADGASLAFILVDHGTKHIYTADRDGKTVSKLTYGSYDYMALMPIMVNGKEHLLTEKVSMSHPADLYRTSLYQSENEAVLTDVNSDYLTKMKFGRVEPRIIKASDGKDILTWVIYPPDFDPKKKYPTLLFCQGGPQSPVSQFWSYRWNFQLMAANGYIIVAPNRRGLQGFGQAWNDAIQGDYGGQCMRDYLSAIDAMGKETYVDKKRLGAVGASFGGYSVYWLAGNHKKRFHAFIAHCGMFNMESWYGTTEEMFFANHDQKGAYWDNPKPYNDGSPHKFVKNWDTPILIIHNERDFRVPLGEGMQAFTAAQIKGVPSRFLYFPDENHWVTKPQNGILWQRMFFDWLKTYLK